MDKWAAQLTNRSADDDRSRLKIMIAPIFKDRRIADVKLSTVMEWIDAQRAATKMTTIKAEDGTEKEETVPRFKEPTIRHGLNLLSRYFGWAVERDYMKVNPVRMISQGSRPKQTPKSDRPWLDDDVLVRRVYNALPPPVDLMFYLGNRAIRLSRARHELCKHTSPGAVGAGLRTALRRGQRSAADELSPTAARSDAVLSNHRRRVPCSPREAERSQPLRGRPAQASREGRGSVPRLWAAASRFPCQVSLPIDPFARGRSNFL